MASSRSPKAEKRERRESEVVSAPRPRMKSFRRVESLSVTERTESRTSGWRTTAFWRMSMSWSWVKGWRSLRASSEVRELDWEAGDSETVPFGSVLRFFVKSMVC